VRCGGGSCQVGCGSTACTDGVCCEAGTCQLDGGAPACP
jgi:hypothetical protein